MSQFIDGLRGILLTAANAVMCRCVSVSAAVSAVLLTATPAVAQVSPVLVEVGKTVEHNVVYARGWSCDDPSLVQARITTRGDQNFWIVTGVKVGMTQCRVGMDPYSPSYVFEVRVVSRLRAIRHTQHRYSWR